MQGVHLTWIDPLTTLPMFASPVRFRARGPLNRRCIHASFVPGLSLEVYEARQTAAESTLKSRFLEQRHKTFPSHVRRPFVVGLCVSHRLLRSSAPSDFLRNYRNHRVTDKWHCKNRLLTILGLCERQVLDYGSIRAFIYFSGVLVIKRLSH